MRTEKLEKVLEKLATTDNAMIVVEKARDGKIRVTSGSWDGEKVILKGQVLEVRNLAGRLPVNRKTVTTLMWARRGNRLQVIDNARAAHR